jgi:hypothetical protein
LTVTAGQTLVQITSNMVDFTEVNPNAAIFTYTPNIVVAEVVPPRGPDLGGTLLTIIGDGFISPNDNSAVSEETFKCRFAGFVIVSAQVVNATHMKCVAPAIDEMSVHDSGAQAVVSVEVSCNGVQFEGLDANGVGANFRYYESIQLLSVSPRSGPHEGGTVISVIGTGFINSPQLACSVNGKWFTAAFVSSHSVRCSVPAADGSSSLSYATLSVSNNGVDLASSSRGSLQFKYEARPTVTRALPSFGSVVGGTSVMVQGAGFVHGEMLVCRFGSTHASKVIFLSTTALLCTTPPATISGVDVEIISVSNNGVDFSTTQTGNKTAVSFSRMETSSLVSVSPSKGSVRGGTSVNVTVSLNVLPFVNSSSSLSVSHCVFGEKKVAAVWDTANASGVVVTATCTSPAVSS